MKQVFFVLFLFASLDSGVIAQTHICYGDTAAPFIDLATSVTISTSQADSGVIIGYAERFDLPHGNEILDSVDFFIDSVGADSNVIDLVPVMSFVSSSGSELLPNFSEINNIKRIYTSTQIFSGSRTSISCGKISVDSSFFVFLVSNIGSNKYRAHKKTAAVNLDTARAALVTLGTKVPFPTTAELVDGNLTSVNVNVDMDIGITYEGSDGVQVHLSPSSCSVEAWPNPTRNGNPIHLNGTDSVISAEVVDEAGRIIQNYQIKDNMTLTEIPTQGLSGGVYNVVLFHSDGTASSVKFVVE